MANTEVQDFKNAETIISPEAFTKPRSESASGSLNRVNMALVGNA